jgi:hypothetical protein
MELGSKESILPISRVGGNEWRVKGEAVKKEEVRGQRSEDGGRGIWMPSWPGYICAWSLSSRNRRAIQMFLATPLWMVRSWPEFAAYRGQGGVHIAVARVEGGNDTPEDGGGTGARTLLTINGDPTPIISSYAVSTEGGRAAGQYELPLGWIGLLPLVAKVCAISCASCAGLSVDCDWPPAAGICGGVSD